jgi:hypothetical protein
VEFPKISTAYKNFLSATTYFAPCFRGCTVTGGIPTGRGARQYIFEGDAV